MIVRRSLTGLGVGMLFGLGLAVSQMTNPEKVLAFLNVAGNWDPSLLLVMGAASGVAFFGYRWATINAPLFESRYYLPSAKNIDRPLILGGMIFGLGWGLAGYCPGPAITGLGSGSLEPLVFVIAMLVGSQVERFAQSREPLPKTANDTGS